MKHVLPPKNLGPVVGYCLVVELVRLRERSVEGHHLYQTVIIVGAVLLHVKENHSVWAIVVKNPPVHHELTTVCT